MPRGRKMLAGLRFERVVSSSWFSEQIVFAAGSLTQTRLSRKLSADLLILPSHLKNWARVLRVIACACYVGSQPALS